MRAPHGQHRARGRRRDENGVWHVRAPISRFIEPAVLLVLRGGPSHGYDLADQLEVIVGSDRVDYGNLYRMLRRLEHEGIVSSEWLDDAPGRSKRTYRLTADGSQLLDAWVEALNATKGRIDAFLELEKGT